MDHCVPHGQRSLMIENQINFPSEWLLSKLKTSTAHRFAPVLNSSLPKWARVTQAWQLLYTVRFNVIFYYRCQISPPKFSVLELVTLFSLQTCGPLQKLMSHPHSTDRTPTLIFSANDLHMRWHSPAIGHITNNINDFLKWFIHSHRT